MARFLALAGSGATGRRTTSSCSRSSAAPPRRCCTASPPVWPGTGRRPVVVTGYVGVVYEKLADGLLLRHGADVVLANSRHDAERFRAVYEGVGADASCRDRGRAAVPRRRARTTGRARPRHRRLRRAALRPGQPRRPDVPAAPPGRARPAAPRARGAAQAPLQARRAHHAHRGAALPEARQAAGDLPPNFRLVYGNMGEVLDRTDLLVTVCSTAALESLHRRIPTAVLTDLGVREVLGNHHFLGSGCLASWDQLDAGHRPAPDAGVGGPAGRGRRRGTYDHRLRRRTRAHRASCSSTRSPPPLDPVLHPRHRARLPARHPRPPPPRPGRHAAAGRSPRATSRRPAPVIRDAVRDAARGAYRHGVQRVAPVIRRMGEL